MKKLTLKSGIIENNTHIRCHQIRCAYYQQGSCQKCEDCGSESFILKKDCQKCQNCAYIEDSLRWDDKKEKISEGLKISEKDIHKAVVAIAAKIIMEQIDEEEPELELIIPRQTR